MKKLLTNRLLKSLKPAAPGERPMIWDVALPGFGVRITDRADARGYAAHRTFIVMRRVSGRPTPVRRKLGQYPAMALEAARRAARKALEDMASGIDPKEHAKEQAREAVQRRQDTFEAVAEEFIKRHVSKLRTAANVTGTIRRELIPRLGKYPLTKVTRRDVVALLEEVVDSGRPYIAHHLLAYLKKLYNWAIARDLYGLENSPCDRVSAKEPFACLPIRTLRQAARPDGTALARSRRNVMARGRPRRSLVDNPLL
jgi:hypothetical protein